jgi:hypothetical protein
MLMTTVFTVDSGRCGWKTRIVAELGRGGMIKLDITSTCTNIKRFGEKFKEISIRDLAKPILVNPVYIAASGTVGPECIVPPAVINTSWTEAGMIARSLLRQFPTQVLRYEGDQK